MNEQQQASEFRLMTYNIGGATRGLASVLPKVIKVIDAVSPHILVVQEATESKDASGAWDSDVSQIANRAGFNHFHFGPTLSMREHMHVGKSLFVRSIFKDEQDWKQGNAIFSREEKFVRLGDHPCQSGRPRSIPIYRTPLYQGNRDTEPRDALLARIDRPPVFPFVVGVHFTTLIAERERNGGPRPLPGRAQEAAILRLKQAKRLIDLLREHVLDRGEVVFLLGDFNAVPSEPCISSVLESEGGFLRLIPKEGPGATHPKALEPIDHILVYPRSRLLEYHCRVVDGGASDHLPVVADVVVSCA